MTEKISGLHWLRFEASIRFVITLLSPGIRTSQQFSICFYSGELSANFKQLLAVKGSGSLHWSCHLWFYYRCHQRCVFPSVSLTNSHVLCSVEVLAADVSRSMTLWDPERPAIGCHGGRVRSQRSQLGVTAHTVRHAGGYCQCATLKRLYETKTTAVARIEVGFLGCMQV